MNKKGSRNREILWNRRGWRAAALGLRVEGLKRLLTGGASGAILIKIVIITILIHANYKLSRYSKKRNQEEI